MNLRSIFMTCIAGVSLPGAGWANEAVPCTDRPIQMDGVVQMLLLTNASHAAGFRGDASSSLHK
jgi:hypothetical protein